MRKWGRGKSFCKEKEEIEELERKWGDEEDEENKREIEREKKKMVGNRWKNEEAGKTPSG